MKSFNFLWLSLLLLLPISCGKDSGGGSSPPVTEVEVTLEELDPENLPSEPTWVVTNENITTSEDFDILREALNSASTEEREVEVVFQSLESMPDNSFTDCEALTSISLPATKSIGESAFSGCTALTTVSVPVAETISDNAFSGCEALEEITLPATKSVGAGAFASCGALKSLSLATDVKLESISVDAFTFTTPVAMTRSGDSSPTLSITLSISSLNWEYINENTLTVGSFSEEFKLIIILGLKDMEPQSPSINDWDDMPLNN